MSPVTAHRGEEGTLNEEPHTGSGPLCSLLLTSVLLIFLTFKIQIFCHTNLGGVWKVYTQARTCNFKRHILMLYNTFKWTDFGEQIESESVIHSAKSDSW